MMVKNTRRGLENLFGNDDEERSISVRRDPSKDHEDDSGRWVHMGAPVVQPRHDNCSDGKRFDARIPREVREFFRLGQEVRFKLEKQSGKTMTGEREIQSKNYELGFPESVRQEIDAVIGEHIHVYLQPPAEPDDTVEGELAGVNLPEYQASDYGMIPGSLSSYHIVRSDGGRTLCGRDVGDRQLYKLNAIENQTKVDRCDKCAKVSESGPFGLMTVKELEDWIKDNYGIVMDEGSNDTYWSHDSKQQLCRLIHELDN